MSTLTREIIKEIVTCEGFGGLVRGAEPFGVGTLGLARPGTSELLCFGQRVRSDRRMGGGTWGGQWRQLRGHVGMDVEIIAALRQP